MFLICWAWRMSGVSMTVVYVALSCSAFCLYLAWKTNSKQIHVSINVEMLVLTVEEITSQLRETLKWWVGDYLCTWLRISVAFFALKKSGVSLAKANMPFPLISCSNDFLYSLCRNWADIIILMWLCAYVCLSVIFTFTPRIIPVGYKHNKKQHKNRKE